MKKEIFIHFGPPKTGTSAIQKWMNENSKLLQKQGLYYPAHSIDKNGVSSGNLLSIFSRGEDSSLYIDSNKVNTLLDFFYSSGKYSKLLLSSEFFFMRMHEVRMAIPDATFIGYLRNPIDKRESQYNQGVKRASFKHKYPNKIHKNAQDFSVLSKYIQEFTCANLVLRPYGDVFFTNSNIASDLLNTIGLKINQLVLPDVNNSYNLEALELKRWLNNFPLNNLAHSIDLHLQSFDAGITDYTLIKPEVLNKQLDIDLRIINSFFELIDVSFSDKFITNAKDSKKKKYYSQNFKSSELRQAMIYLKNKLGSQSEVLLDILEHHEEGASEHGTLFIKILKERSFYKRIINKLANKFNF